MPKKKPEHYVNNKEFLDALVVYKLKIAEAEKKYIEKYGTNPPKTGNWDGKPRIPNYLGECFLKIATHFSYKPNFVNYTYKDEMISDGIENCLQYIDNFDPSKSNNPFAYFTQIIYYAFIRRIHKEKKQSYIKHKTLEHSIVFNTLVESDTDDHFDAVHVQQDNERINNLIDSVERKTKKPKKKKGLQALS